MSHPYLELKMCPTELAPTNCCCFITNAPSSSHSQVRNLEVHFPLPHKPSSVSLIYSLLRVSRFRCPRLQLCSQKPSKWPPFSALVHLPPFSSCSYKCLEDRPGCAYPQLTRLLPARARSRPSQAGRNTAAWPLHLLLSPRVLIATPKTIYIPGFPSLNIVCHPIHCKVMLSVMSTLFCLRCHFLKYCFGFALCSIFRMKANIYTWSWLFGDTSVSWQTLSEGRWRGGLDQF